METQIHILVWGPDQSGGPTNPRLSAVHSFIISRWDNVWFTGFFRQIYHRIKNGCVSDETGTQSLTTEQVCERIFQEVDLNSDGMWTGNPKEIPPNKRFPQYLAVRDSLLLFVAQVRLHWTSLCRAPTGVPGCRTSCGWMSIPVDGCRGTWVTGNSRVPKIPENHHLQNGLRKREEMPCRPAGRVEILLPAMCEKIPHAFIVQYNTSTLWNNLSPLTLWYKTRDYSAYLTLSIITYFVASCCFEVFML